jgi:hypothetical protein
VGSGFGSFAFTLIRVSGTTALPSTGSPVFVLNTVGGAQTITLPSAPVNGQVIIVKQAINNAGPCTVKSASSGTPIDGTAGSVGIALVAFGILRVVWDGTANQWWIW